MLQEVCQVQIGLLLPSANDVLRTHWSKRRKFLKALSWLIRSELGPSPPEPIERARIRIVRYTPRVLLDPDALGLSVKPLLDCLVMPTKRNPCGLGWIRDDSPKCLDLVLDQAKGPSGFFLEISDAGT